MKSVSSISSLYFYSNFFWYYKSFSQYRSHPYRGSAKKVSSATTPRRGLQRRLQSCEQLYSSAQNVLCIICMFFLLFQSIFLHLLLPYNCWNSVVQSLMGVVHYCGWVGYKKRSQGFLVRPLRSWFFQLKGILGTDVSKVSVKNSSFCPYAVSSVFGSCSILLSLLAALLLFQLFFGWWFVRVQGGQCAKTLCGGDFVFWSEKSFFLFLLLFHPFAAICNEVNGFFTVNTNRFV